MRDMFWNIRGLIELAKHKHVKELAKHKHVGDCVQELGLYFVAIYF